MKKILLSRNWRHGLGMIHTGVYRVPEDMSEEMAQRAMEEVGAEIVGPPAPATQQPEAADDGDMTELRDEYERLAGEAPDGRLGAARLRQEIVAMKMKAGAPENKSPA